MLHARSLLAVISATLALCPAVASAQESRIASLREAGRDGASTLQLGRAMRRAGRFDEAVRTLQGVRDAALRNDALWEIARVRFDQGVFQAARGACMAFPMPSAHMALADLLEHTQRETEAMGAWDAAIDRAPSDMTPRLRAAELAHRTHQNALARAYLDRVLTDDPNSARALMLRGTIAMEDGDRAAARQFLDQSLHGNGEIDRAAVQRMITELDTPPRTRRR